MSIIPPTGNLGVDISIAVITGGVVTTWLTIFLDKLHRKREEYMDIAKQKIAKITRFETASMQIASHLSEISLILSQSNKSDSDYDRCVYYIALYLHKWRSLTRDAGFIQLDNIYSENVIQEFAQHLYVTLLDTPSIGLRKIDSLRDMIDDNTSFQTFIEKLSLSSPHNEREVAFNAFRTYIQNLTSDESRIIVKRAEWYYRLLSIELNLAYKIFYGEAHVKEVIKRRPFPSELE